MQSGGTIKVHERSLVKTLIEQILEELRIRRLGRLHEVQLQIGEFSGVESTLVASAFAEMSIEYWKQEVLLRIDVVPLTAACQNCGNEFHVQSFRFVCPECGCGNVQVTAGEGMQLASLRAEQAVAYEGVTT